MGSPLFVGKIEMLSIAKRASFFSHGVYLNMGSDGNSMNMFFWFRIEDLLEVADPPDSSNLSKFAMLNKLGQLCRHSIPEKGPGPTSLRRVLKRILSSRLGPF